MGDSIKRNSLTKQPIALRILNKAANFFGASVVKGAVPYSFFRMYGASIVWGVWKNKTYITDGYMKNAALYSVIRRITKTAAVAPFKVYRVKDQKKFAKYKSWTGAGATKESLLNAMRIKSLVYEEDNKHPLNELINKPNPWQGAAEFTESCVGFKLLTGNRFLLLTVLDIGANTGKVAALVNLPPDDVAVKSDGTLFGVDSYVLSIGQEKPLPKDAVIHSKYWNPNIDAQGSHLKGLSPLSAGERNLTINDLSENRSASELKNAGANGVLFNKNIGEWSQEQAAEMKNKLHDDVLGVENAAKIAVANGDLGYLQFGQNSKELGTIEKGATSKQEICNIYGVPYVLMNSDNSTYNNIKEAKTELLSMAVVPELVSLRDDWNVIAKSYKDDNLYVDFDITAYPEMQEDLEKTVRIMKDAYWITPNEKRLAMNMDEDADEEMMDRYLVPSGLTEITQLNPENIQAQMDQVDEQMNQEENKKPNAQ